MIKVHLQNPKTDGLMLVQGTKICFLILDGESKVPKVAKGCNILAPNDFLTIIVSSSNLSCLSHYEILTEIIIINCHRKQE
jgi:hypothetical protein